MRSSLCAPLVLATALLAAASPAVAKYAPIPLGRRIVEARAIAIGRIEALEDTHYRFRVERWIHGEARPDTLQVRRFHDWTCARRPVPYAAGQRMVVFLDGEPDEWQAMGAGCEGEAILADGKARVIHAPFGPGNALYPEEEFVLAVASYRALHREVGADGWVEAWHRLLAHQAPIVAMTAMDDLQNARLMDGREKGVPVAPLVGALWAIFESGPPDVRARMARTAEWSFGPDAAPLLVPRLLGLAGEGGARGHSARLALAALEPGGIRFSEILDALGDPETPIEDRRALADQLAATHWLTIPPVPLSHIAAAAARLLRRETDAALLLRVLEWLAENFEGEPKPVADIAPHIPRWLERFDAAMAEAPAPPAATAAGDPLLPPEQFTVAIPAEVPAHERAAVAWTVRAIRRARNAEAAGDTVTARREYGTALAGLFGGVEDAARALGADPAFARERLAALETR